MNLRPGDRIESVTELMLYLEAGLPVFVGHYAVPPAYLGRYQLNHLRDLLRRDHVRAPVGPGVDFPDTVLPGNYGSMMATAAYAPDPDAMIRTLPLDHVLDDWRRFTRDVGSGLDAVARHSGLLRHMDRPTPMQFYGLGINDLLDKPTQAPKPQPMTATMHLKVTQDVIDKMKAPPPSSKAISDMIAKIYDDIDRRLAPQVFGIHPNDVDTDPPRDDLDLPTRKQAEPIRAWRTWKLSHSAALGWHLCSVVSGAVWEGPILRADAPPANGKPGWRYRGAGHGIYAYKGAERAREQILNDPDQHVLGEIELMGKVVVHESGFRAEHARIASLEVVDATYTLLTIDQTFADVQRDLEARYQCTVTITAEEPKQWKSDVPSK